VDAPVAAPILPSLPNFERAQEPEFHSGNDTTLPRLDAVPLVAGTMSPTEPDFDALFETAPQAVVADSVSTAVVEPAIAIEPPPAIANAVDALAEAAARKIIDTPSVQAAAAAMNAAVNGAIEESLEAAIATVPGATAEPAPLNTALMLPLQSAASRTLEDTVADLLKPMLREWLDSNMPRIIEKALSDERSPRG
jgi:cell pole-organizing protein PopZ